MRQLRLFLLLATIAVIAPSSVPAGVKGGRDYRKQQREILEIKKQLAIEEREVDEFEELLDEMNSLHMPSRFDDFFKVNKEIRKAMSHEYDQLKVRVDGEGADDAEETGVPKEVQDAALGGEETGAAVTDDKQSASAERLGRMKAVILESGGLQQAIALGDMDVVPRYRHLVGDFLVLMREDIDEAWADVHRLEARWE